ncbi:hypothetical protein DSM110093_03967 (plasmid) [Sulfitobacter sp. DSM 110093]|nr:hypothetical protein DSM110093_03967 [Sulfitobacter sp. DSM 110093]
MKTLLAAFAVSFALPLSAMAQGDVQTVTCSVADIRSGAGVCSQVEMPQPPADVTVRVRRVSTTTTTPNTLGGLGAPGIGLIALGVIGVAAAASGGGSSNGTN